MFDIYYYPTCSTCKKAIKWLNDHDVEVNLIHIVEATPSKERLKEVLTSSGLTLNKLFNSSGKKYRELNMKDQLKTMTEDEALALLASEGMLIKRPILFGKGLALVGFKEVEWGEKIL